MSFRGIIILIKLNALTFSRACHLHLRYKRVITAVLKSPLLVNDMRARFDLHYIGSGGLGAGLAR